MTTSADQPTESAPSNPIELSSLTPAERQNWRNTGELPPPPKTEASATSEKSAGQNQDQNQDSSAAAKSTETRSASEAQTAQEKDGKDKDRGKSEKRTSGTPAEDRVKELLVDRKRDRDRIDQLERDLSEFRQGRDGKQGSQPAAEAKTAEAPKSTPKPKIDDKDDKGQLKYKTYDEYLDARDEWLRTETKRELEEGQSKSQRESEQRKAQEVVQREWSSRVEKARAQHADFDDVALAADLPIKVGSAVDAFLLESAHGTEVLYHLGANRAELERIQGKPVYDAKGVLQGFRGGLNPLTQVRELVKLEGQFSTEAAAATKQNPPAPPKTQAAKPPSEVGGRSTQSDDPLYSAAEAKDFRSFKRESNRQALAGVKR